MKKLLLSFAGLLGAASMAQATVSFEIDAGVLSNSAGTALTNGSLLQLVATRSGANGTFVSPTATSYVGGSTDNVVVASFPFNQGGSGFAIGETDSSITLTLENTGAASATKFDAGDALLLRWYPSIQYATYAANPNAGPGAALYGQYRSAGTETLKGNPYGSAWITPGDGTQDTLGDSPSFLTKAAGGTNADTVGQASTPVPEPSVYAMFIGSFAGLMGLRVWGRRKGFCTAA